MKKYKIQKGTVMETLLIPLYGKYKASILFPDLFGGNDAKDIISKIEYSFKEPFKLKMKIGAIMAAVRQYDLAYVAKEYLKNHPSASVVNLGCGLDTTFNELQNGYAKGYNIDFDEVIDLRNELIGEKEREINIASDLNDYSWFEKVEFDEKKGIILFGSGLFYYFKKEDVKNLIVALAKRFPGGKIVFDATNARGLKKMLKTWLEPTKMGEVGLYFSVEDEQEILDWSDKIDSVSSKGYIGGYMPMSKEYGLIATLLFKYIDCKKLGQIIEIEFKK